KLQPEGYRAGLRGDALDVDVPLAGSHEVRGNHFAELVPCFEAYQLGGSLIIDVVSVLVPRVQAERTEAPQVLGFDGKAQGRKWNARAHCDPAHCDQGEVADFGRILIVDVVGAAEREVVVVRHRLGDGQRKA